ncbi:MAG: hypothetical protein IJF75_00355 [Clostridia bacterium]|nr:hypothetical protein [Clostridia bacterium]
MSSNSTGFGSFFVELFTK